MDPDVVEGHVVAGRYVEAVAVVRSWEPRAERIRRVAGRVVKRQPRYGDVFVSSDIEAVNGPVDDVQALDDKVR